MVLLLLLVLLIALGVYAVFGSAFSKPKPKSRGIQRTSTSVPKVYKPVPLEFTWNGVDPQTSVIYNPIGKAFRDNCVEALGSFSDGIMQTKGKVIIEVRVDGIFQIDMKVRFIDVESATQFNAAVAKRYLTARTMGFVLH